MPKMVEFYHYKGIGAWMYLPSLACNCLHSSTSAKPYPFTESKIDLFSKVPEDMVERPSIVITSEAVVDKTPICESTIVCKSIVGIDASRF